MGDANSIGDADVERGDSAEDGGGEAGPPVYSLTEEPYTTLQMTWAPINATDDTEAAVQAGDFSITEVDEYERYGLGVERAPGQPWVEKRASAPGFAEPSSGQRRSLLYGWHSTDPQVIDEESPIRFEGVTSAPFGSTYRPQSHLTTQVFEAHVRSARRISEVSGRPFDLALVTGDMTDGGQQNELDWVLEILAGGVIHPDSGADNDPVPGRGNDFTDRFRSAGLDVPWYMGVGNHETTYMGTFPAIDAVKQGATDDEVFNAVSHFPVLDDIDGIANGYRDASTPTSEVVTTGELPPDEARRILPLEDVLQRIQQAPGEPVGHGMTLGDALDGVGYFSFHPFPGRPLRVIMLNTLAQSPPDVRGAIGDEQEQWLRDQLASADRRDELVIVAGHHRSSDFRNLSDLGANEFESLLAGYDNVVMYLVGHIHNNAVRHVDPHDDTPGYWELTAASTVDFPLQTRILEVVWEQNGYLSIYATNLGHNSPPGTPGHQGRVLAAGRKAFTGTDPRSSWEDQQAASNLLIRHPMPSEVAAELSNYDWPMQVESTETLQELEAPAPVDP